MKTDNRGRVIALKEVQLGFTTDLETEQTDLNRITVLNERVWPDGERDGSFTQQVPLTLLDELVQSGALTVDDIASFRKVSDVVHGALE